MYTVKRQYSTVKPFFVADNALLASTTEDKERLQAYAAFEDFYYNRPETLSIVIRGDGEPLYMPSSREIIEAKNRFLAKNYGFMVKPGQGEADDIAACQMYMENLWRREEVKSKFDRNRRMGLIRGDAVWHITANPSKIQGQRLSIQIVNPAAYFPIEDPNVSGRVIGVHLVDEVQDPRDTEGEKTVARRQTYRKMVDANNNPTGLITSELTLFETDGWDDRDPKNELKQVRILTPQFTLPPAISSIPVYHIRNRSFDSVIMGLSELSGIETLINGMNQSLSDEDLTLVMQGLGMYMTTAGAPKNADGSTGAWNLGPGQVIEIGQDQVFERVTGVSTVAPMQEHIKAMHESIGQGLGVPEIAAGRVDVQVAESGISLSLQLAPMLADNAEKELEILGRMDQMWHDVTSMWLPAYEQTTFTDVEVISTIDDPMPVNRDQRIQEVLLLQQGGLITIAMAQAELGKLGYSFNPGDDTKVVQEAQALALAKSGDPFQNRWAEETKPADTSTAGIGEAANVAAPAPAAGGATV